MRPRRFAALAAFVAITVSGAAIWWVAHPPQPGLLVNGRHPDIILVTVDALRADHLGVYGYDRPTSPNLDRFAAEALVVRHHISQAPFTKASIASIFTGLFPTTHKAFTTSRGFGEAMTGHIAGTPPSTDVLDPALWRLSSALRAAGYATVGLNTNPFLIADFGFGEGFDRYDFLVDGDSFAPAEHVIARALERIDQRDRTRPLFLWLHLMEPHSPYVPKPEYRALFRPRTPPLPVPPDVIPSWIATDGSTDVHFYEALYDAEVRETDTALGRFFDALKARGIWPGLVLAITADHGEEFFEHGRFEHNITLYDEMLRVPLLLKVPGLRAGMTEVQTQAVDLAPTLVALAGGDAPRRLAGSNLWRPRSPELAADPLAYAERSGELFALRTGEWKFVSDLQARHELYHLTDDPGEQHDLAPFDRDRTAELRNRLRAIVAAAVSEGGGVHAQFSPINPRVLKRLQSLGYIR